MSTKELVNSFTVVADEDHHFIELAFVSQDVGMENVDKQSDLVFDAITEILDAHPDINDWHVLADTSKTSVSSMSKYSMAKYRQLIKKNNVKKVAVLLADTDKQNMVTRFVVEALAKTTKKISLFTIPEEAKLWLNM